MVSLVHCLSALIAHLDLLLIETYTGGSKTWWGSLGSSENLNGPTTAITFDLLVHRRWEHVRNLKSFLVIFQRNRGLKPSRMYLVESVNDANDANDALSDCRPGRGYKKIVKRFHLQVPQCEIQ